jgi:predicted RNA-binding protein with PUA-like domain
MNSQLLSCWGTPKHLADPCQTLRVTILEVIRIQFVRHSMTMTMANWLLKTEPREYSADDLARDMTTTWDGIANAAARNHIRSMARGDRVVIYHTGDERRCVALAEVVSAPRADPASEDEKAVVVDLKFKSMLPSPVRLDQIKADKAFEGWDLLRIGRLSVVPTPDKIWNRLIELSSTGKAK